MTDLNQYELLILRYLNGESVDNLSWSWGAAMGAAVEFLREFGYIKGFFNIIITNKGKEYLKNVSPNSHVG